MKTIILASALSAIVMPFALAGEGWETNMDAAKKKAAEENKGLLIEFTGSDWCGPCMNLKKTVLTKDEFLNAAQKGFVLVELDYPRKKLSPEQTAHNDKYKQEYGIRGYPTVIFTDAKGLPVHSFIGGRDLETVLAEISTAEGNKTFVEETLAKLKDAKGDERYVLIGELFKKVPVDYMDQFYPDLAAEIKNDTGDKSGLKKVLDEKRVDAEFRKIMQSVPREIARDSQKVYDYLDGHVKKLGQEAEPLLRQKLLALQANMLFSLSKVEESIGKLEEAVKAAPDSAEAATLAKTREYREQNKEMIILGLKNQKDLREYLANLSQDDQNNPGKFAAALERFKEGRTLDPQTYNTIVQQIAFARVADGKTDEALILMQEVIDAPESPQVDEKSRNILKSLKSHIERNKEKMEQDLKKFWEKKASGKVIPAATIQ